LVSAIPPLFQRYCPSPGLAASVDAVIDELVRL
jgi:hypothetical protein